MLLADGLIDLRLGRWQDVLADVTTCDSLITDPPFSARTHEAQNHFASLNAKGGTPVTRRALPYSSMSLSDAIEFATVWSSRCAGWTAIFSSHDLVDSYADAHKAAGRYVFAPLPAVIRGMTVRLSGDGPSSWTCWLTVSRPQGRPYSAWGTLDGAYTSGVSDARFGGFPGGKPLPLMRAIVRDYTRPGDLVVDPFCGGGTTALACAIEGRRCITSEMDPVTFEKARKRLERGFTPSMFQQGPKVKAKQGGLL